MKKVIQYIDLYGPQITLTYNKSYKYKTTLGGILTIFTIFAIIIYTILYSKILFSKNNFKIITSYTVNPSSSYDFSNFPFLIGFSSPEGMIVKDERLFNIKIFDYNYTLQIKKNTNRKFSLSSEEILYENCSKYKSNKTYFLNDTFSDINLDNYQCIKPGENLTLYGKFGDITNSFRSFGIILNKCNNETLRINKKNFSCYSEEDIKKKLIGFKVIILYISYNLNHYAVDGSHLFYHETGDYLGLTAELQKFFVMTFSKNVYITDKSFIFDNKNISEFFSLSGKIVDNYPMSLNFGSSQIVNNNTFGVILMSMDGTVVQYNRSFEKITDLFAKLGGIYNLIIIVSKIIIKWITSKRKIIDFVNSLPFKQYKIEKNKNYRNDRNDNKFHSNLQLFVERNRPKLSKAENINNINHNFNLSINNSSELILKKKNVLEDIKEVNSNKSNVNNNSKNIKKIEFDYRNESIKKNIKKLGFNVLWFYICPFFFIKKCKKFNFFYFLYQRLIENLSIEKVFTVMSKWPIVETIINDKIKDNNYVIKEKTNIIKFNSKKLSRVNCINLKTLNNN